MKRPKTLCRPTVLMRVSGERAANSFLTQAQAAADPAPPVDKGSLSCSMTKAHFKVRFLLPEAAK